MSAVSNYFSDVRERLNELERSQAVAIDTVASLGAGAIIGRRPIHIFDTGHLINHEFIDRTGGLAAYTSLSFGGTLARGNEWVNATRGALDSSGERSSQLLVDWVFEQGVILPGDLLILSSVSGTNTLVVELARQAVDRGIQVVAVTGVEFSSKLVSNHSSGKRLFEVAGAVLDNRAPYGDAALAVDGVGVSVAAWSGLAGAALMWAVTAGIVEKCAAAGIEPTIYSSYNLPGGGERYTDARAKYRECGQ